MNISNRSHHHTAYIVALDPKLNNILKDLSEQAANHPGDSESI
jgi:hypothetical protein